MPQTYIDASGNGKAFYTGYQHAFKLYLSDQYKNVPKAAFMYFIKFNLNPNIQNNQLSNGWNDEWALLAKSVQLPKFKISTETVNQYNRKSNIQTKINYEPVTIEMHDDMGGGTNNFWQTYYRYFYQDSRNPNITSIYSDNKYKSIDNKYGLNSSGEQYFLTSIDIFVLHQGNFTEMKLINPIISSWEHDTVAQSEGLKFLQNKMTVVYEDVLYDTGRIVDSETAGFFEYVYDTTPSPLANPIVAAIQPPYNGAAYEEEENYTSAVYPSYGIDDPKFSYNMRKKGQLSIGALLSGINTVKTFISNPRQAMSVYGLNIKTLVVNAAANKISATPINLSGNPAPSTTQGQTNFSDQGNGNTQ